VTRFAELLRALTSGAVDFIVVGGVAVAHGSPRSTQRVDVVYSRAHENLSRLVLALGPYQPYLRDAPPGLPFRFDVETLSAGLNFTLTTTDLGWIDLLGEIVGGGRYEDLVAHSVQIEAFGLRCPILDLETLIRTKRAAGRPKDFEVLAELEALRERAKE